MARIKCVVFDLGDTLFDTKNANMRTQETAPEKRVLEESGHFFSMSEYTAAKLRFNEDAKRVSPKQKIENPLVYSHIFLESLGVKPTKTLAGKCERAFYAERERQMALLPGALEALDYLKSRGIVQCVITNTYNDCNLKAAKRLGIRKYFMFFLMSHRFGSMKSELKIFRSLLEKVNRGRKMKVLPGECLMVGNDAQEDGAAKEIGMKVALLKPTLRREEHLERVKPDYMLESLEGIMEIV